MKKINLELIGKVYQELSAQVAGYQDSLKSQVDNYSKDHELTADQAAAILGFLSAKGDGGLTPEQWNVYEVLNGFVEDVPDETHSGEIPVSPTPTPEEPVEDAETSD